MARRVPKPEPRPRRRQVITGVTPRGGSVDAEIYGAFVACTDDALLVADFDSATVVKANPAACEMFGYPPHEWQGIRGRDLHPKSEMAFVDELSRRLNDEGRARSVGIRMQRRDGSVFSADLLQNVFTVSGRCLMVGIIRDVTERERRIEALERTQAMMLHAQKLASVGEVAAGIVHEINNPAGFVALNLDYLDEGLAQLAEWIEHHNLSAPFAIGDLREVVRESRGGVQRIASVARELRVFSREDPLELVAVHMPAVVRSAVAMVGNELRHRGRLDVSCAPSLPAVAGDQGKLTQVLTNLMVNALQALDEHRRDRNAVWITTRRDGDEVVLAVTDNGSGMPPEVCARAMEPFFTTKERDHGTGLGLPVCADIIQQHGGRMSLRSDVTSGTCVEVWLPIHQAPTDNEARASAPRSLRPAAGRRVLVIDDEPNMRSAFRRMLRGHEVVGADSAKTAQDLIENDSDFDLIICDLMLSDADGASIYRFIDSRAPSLAARVVFCTGGALTESTRELIARTSAPVLYKPIDRRKLFALLSGDTPRP